MGKIFKKHLFADVTGTSRTMNLIVGLTSLMSVVTMVTAQVKIECFSKVRGREVTSINGIELDCSNTAGKNNPYNIDEWNRYHAFFKDGALANRVLRINLENNNFQKMFTLPPMVSLTKLSFKYNKISAIQDGALSKLPALEELDLSYNLLNSHELRESVFRIDTLPNKQIVNDKALLKVLKLGHNNIHSLPPECFEYLTNLEKLELNNNPLSVIDQPTAISLGYLTNLKLLDLANTSLSKFPEGVFSQLPNVEMLYLNGNQFKSVPEEIRDMPLAYLNLNANPIERLDNESFVGLDKLQELIISGMPKLTEIGSGTFAPLKKLIMLHMSFNPSLSIIQYDAFGDWETNEWSLRQLSLSNTNLTSIDSKLCPWEKLESLDAKGNRWTCDCRLSWLSNYINATFAPYIPETLLYYRCKEPKDLAGTLVSQLNGHIDCDDFYTFSDNHSHGHVTRLRHFVIVIGLVISIFVFGSLINMGCREIKRILKPKIHVPARFSTGVKYRPADFEDMVDEEPVKNTTIHGRAPIVINNTE